EADDLRIDVVDGRGTVLGTAEVAVAAREPTPVVPEKAPDLAPATPLVQLSAATNVPWWSPTAPDAVALSGAAGSVDGSRGLNGALRASGSVGAFGLDAMVVFGADTAAMPAAPSGVDRSAWLGGRWRSFRLPGSQLELGPALRIGIPVQGSGPQP